MENLIRVIAVLVVVLMIGVFSGCDFQGDGEMNTDMNGSVEDEMQMDDEMTEQQDMQAEAKDNYETQVVNEYDEMINNVAILKAEANAEFGEISLEWESLFDDIEQQRQEFEQELDNLVNSSAEGWVELRADVEAELNDYRDAYIQARNQLDAELEVTQN